MRHGFDQKKHTPYFQRWRIILAIAIVVCSFMGFRSLFPSLLSQSYVYTPAPVDSTGGRSAATVIVYSPTSGLGNSVLSLVSVRALADFVDLPFLIDWDENSTHSCRAAYKEIFNASPTYLITNELKKGLCGKRACELELTQGGSDICWQTVVCGNKSAIEDMFKPCRCVKVRGNHYFLSAFSRHLEKYTFRKMADVFLQPSTHVSELVSRTLHHWKETINVTHIVGVHVRAAFHSEGTMNGHFLPQPYIFRRIYWPCIQKIVSDLPYHRVGVFVAADTPEVREEAYSLLDGDGGGHKLISLQPPINRSPRDTGFSPERSAQEVMDAALELFLLRNSDTLVVRREGIFPSTFSSVAVSLADCADKTACYFVTDNQGTCSLGSLSYSPDYVLPGNKSNCKKFKLAGGLSCALDDLKAVTHRGPTE